MGNMVDVLQKLEPLRAYFPKFHAKLTTEMVDFFEFHDADYILPPASADEIALIEHQIGLALPKSYKQFLSCVRSFRGPMRLHRTPTTFGGQHPFTVDSAYLRGTICVAEYFLEADSDQIYLDARQGLINDEYPALYYAHDYAPEPRCLRKVTDSFGEWLENL